MKERYENYMWMRGCSDALNEIAHLIYYQAPLKDQDAWLKAAILLGHVEKPQKGDEKT